MADLYYYEEGYIDVRYHVYVADAEIALGPYIEENYIDAHYYDDYSGVASLTCELTLRPGETVSATGTWTSEFTHTATVGRLQSATANFTSAFSPTLTVDAFKNHTAIIESTTTFTVDAQANRSANVLLEHIANLNAQAAKTAVIDSTMATTATVSAQANHSVVSSATLTSTTTVTCLALNVQFGTVAMSVGSALWSKGYLRYERPLQLKQNVGSCEISTTTKKYGAGSLYVPGGLAYIEYYADSNNFIPTYNNDNWLIEFWINVEFLDNNAPIITFTDGTTDYWRFYYLVNQYRFDYKSAGGTIFTKNTTTAYSGSWVHVLIAQSSNNRFGIYINGSRKSSDNALSFTEPNLNGTLRIGGLVSNQFRGYIDELRFINGSDSLPYDLSQTTITVPTAPFSNTETTQFLGHYNVDFSDDVTLVKEYSAALTSTASVTAIGTNVKGAASASLTSTVSVSANAGKLQTVSAALTAAVTQSTAAVKTVQAVLDLTANVSVSVTAFRIKEFASNQNALFTPNIICQAQLAGVALLETQFTQSTSAVKTARTTTAISAVATISAAMTVTAGLAADLTSVSTVTATAYRIQTFASALASAGTLTCDFVAFNNVSAAFTSTVSVTAAVERYRLTSSTLSTAVTLTADIERFRLTSSTLSTTVSVTATATRIQSADSALSSVVTQSTVAVKTASISSSVTISFTQTSTPVKTVSAIPQLTSIATQLTVAYQNATGTVSLTATSTLTALIGVIRQDTNNTSTGLQITDNEPYIDNLTGMPFFGLKVRGNGFTASIWARRESTPGTPQPLWSSTGDSGGLIFNGTDLLIRFNYDPDEPNAVWDNVVPTDGEWHQYLIRSVINPVNGTFPVYNWQLWIDGVYQGQSSSYFAAGAIDFSNGGRAQLGNGLIRNLTGGYELSGRRLTGAIAQVWMGLTNDQQFNPVLFYDGGYVDLGSTGTLGGLLPTPLIYNPLQTPFTGITGTGLTTATTPLGYSPTVIRATTAITANAVSLVIANTVITATQTTLISYSVRPVIAVTSSATLSVSVTAFTGIISNVASTATLVCDETKINGGSAAVSAVSTIQAVAGFFENFSSSVTTAATLECDFDNIPPIRAEANLLAQFTVTANATSFTDAIIMTMSAGTVTCDVTVIPPIRATANLTTTATLTAVVGSIEQFASLVMSAGTMSITASKTTGIILTVTAQCQVTATVKHYKGIILTLSAFNTQLTAGEVINIDPYLTITVEPETRLWKIDAESRIIVIEQETRVNIV